MSGTAPPRPRLTFVRLYVPGTKGRSLETPKPNSGRASPSSPLKE